MLFNSILLNSQNFKKPSKMFNDSKNYSIVLEWSYNLNKKLCTYSLFTILPLGIIFNLIQILVYIRKKFSLKSMSFYYIAIALNNVLILIITGVRFLAKIDFYDFEENTRIGCMLISYLERVVINASPWLNFLLTIDRLLFIIYPRKWTFLKKTKSVCIIIIVTYFSLCSLNATSFLIVKSINKLENQNILVKICSSTKVISLIREVLCITFGFLLPFFFMFNTNLLLIKKVMESRKKFKYSRDVNFSFTLIISNILFIFALLPLSLFSLFKIMVEVNPLISLKPNFASFFRLFDTCSLIIACYDFSFGLFLQIIFNRLFREEFVLLLSDLWPKIFTKN